MNSRSSELSGAPPRILIVGDNPLNVLLVKTLLAPEGHELAHAGDVPAALSGCDGIMEKPVNPVTFSADLWVVSWPIPRPA